MTSFNDPYADAFDAAGGSFSYAYRRGPIDQPDNRALRAAFELQTPVVYFRALAPGQYWVVAPAFVTADDPAARMVALDAGLPVQDMQPGGLVSPPDLRAYATREARYRLHQQRFKLDVMRAYGHRCAICTLRERELVQAAHVVPDTETEGVAALSTASRCARSTTSRSTATCSASTPQASCTSPAGCCARSTARCCAPACRGSTAVRSRCRGGRRTDPIRTGLSCASSVSSGRRPDVPCEGKRASGLSNR